MKCFFTAPEAGDYAFLIAVVGGTAQLNGTYQLVSTGAEPKW